MNVVHLHGSLAKYGGPFTLHAHSPRDAARALALQMPELKREILAGQFHIVVRNAIGEFEIGHQELDFKLRGDPQHVHITPILAGSNKGGAKMVVGFMILAAAIVFSGGAAIGLAGMEGVGGAGAAFADAMATEVVSLGALGSITFGDIAMVGGAMFLSGLASNLSSTPKADFNQFNSPDKRQSFLFNNNQANLTEEGNVVALVYGEMIIGTFVLSEGLHAEEFTG